MKKQTLFGWNVFKKTHEIEKMITAFLLNIIQAGIFYGQAMNCYATSGVDVEFKSLMQKVSDLEAQNDSYRRLVENNLYAYMILPDMRSDILRLLEMSASAFLYSLSPVSLTVPPKLLKNHSPFLFLVR